MFRGFEEVRKEFKKHREAVKLPTSRDNYSVGYDFYSPERIVIPPFGKSGVISTDVKAYMQYDEMLLLHVPNSVSIEQGLTLANCIGIIDSDYLCFKTIPTKHKSSRKVSVLYKESLCHL